MWPSNPATGHTPWENHNSKGHKYSSVYCSTIYNSQEMKATLMSIDGWMKKLACIYIYNGIFSSVAQSCPTLCNPMDFSMLVFLVHHQLPELAQIRVYWISSSVVSFSSCLQSFQDQVLFQWIHSLYRWSKHWSFSFSISPSNLYSGLISFRMDWLDLLAF